MDRRDRPYDPFIERMRAKRLLDLGAPPPSDKNTGSKTEKAPADWWGWTTQFWKGVAIVYLNIVIIGIIAYSLNDLITEFSSNRIAVEPIVVPKALSDKGYTSETAANELRDALIEFRPNRSKTSEDVYVETQSDDALPNITVPGIGVPLETVAALIRTIKRLGPNPSLSGEIILIDNKLQLSLIQDGSDKFRSVTTGEVEHPEKLFKTAATNFLKKSDPAALLAYLSSTKPDQAAALAREIIDQRPETDPAVARAHEILGNLLQRYQRKECKGPDQTEYAARLKEAEKEYSKAIELAPHLADPYNGLGLALAAQNKIDDALALFETAIKLNPRYAAPYNNLGVFRRRTSFGDDPQLIQDVTSKYKKAIEIEPKNPIHHYNLGLVLYQEKQSDEAIREFKKAVELKVHYASPHISLGIALRDAKHRPDAAIEEFDKAIKSDGCLALARYQKGATLHDLKKFDEAVIEYEQAMKIDEKYAAPNYGRGHVLYCNRRDVDSAIVSFVSASDLDRKNALYAFSSGVALFENGRLDEALTKLAQAVSLDRGNADFRDVLGEALLAQHRIEEAQRAFAHAIALNPRDAGAHDRLGRILRAQGKRHEAVENFRAAVGLAPDNWEYHADLGNLFSDIGEETEADWQFEAARTLAKGESSGAKTYSPPGRNLVCSSLPRK